MQTPQPGFVVTKVTSVTDKAGAILREFTEQRRERGPQFEVPSGHIVKGISALHDADGRVINQWVKTTIDKGLGDIVEALKHVFGAYSGRAQLIKGPTEAAHDRLSVYPIADQHHGLLAWGKETGEAYDLAIGIERLRGCAQRLISQSPPSALALILNLGDWTHLDDNRNVTPRSGFQLDVDSRYFKILTAGVQVMMDVIELTLQRHQRVIVRNVPGNHDPHASIALTVALSAFYAANPRVTIDDDPGPFFFHRFGTTLIGATHGHNIKPKDMAMTMATTRRADWGATDYHYFYFGHVHHVSAVEVGDVVCESFRTIAANDAWHHAAGYHSGRTLTSITIDAVGGEIGRHRVNVPRPERA